MSTTVVGQPIALSAVISPAAVEAVHPGVGLPATPGDNSTRSLELRRLTAIAGVEIWQSFPPAGHGLGPRLHGNYGPKFLPDWERSCAQAVAAVLSSVW